MKVGPASFGPARLNATALRKVKRYGIQSVIARQLKWDRMIWYSNGERSSDRFPGNSRWLLGVVAFAAFLFAFNGHSSRGLSQDQPQLGGLAIMAAAEEATIAAIEKAEQSVVAIARIPRNKAQTDRVNLNSLRLGTPFAFDDSPSDPDFVPSIYGSGVVFSEDGFIVTCAHVLDDPRENDYFVWLDKRTYPARAVRGEPSKVYAADPFSDLAVLKIDAENLTPISFGNVETLKKGRFVIALGNPDAIARDGQASASWGIISNLSRVAPGETNEANTATKETIHQYGTLIQTDAKLNLGTSGGALIDLQGNMIGLTTSLAARTGYEKSAGFAIAADETFQRVIQTLKLGKLPEYGFLGIQPEDIPASDLRDVYGAQVSVVIPGLPGDLAGLQTEDVIVAVGAHPIRNRNDLFRELSLIAAGDEVPLTVLRYRPGARAATRLTLPARMSKKFVSTLRPSYSIDAPLQWRGMSVEYVTAFPNDQTRSGLLSHRGAPQIAALTVEPGTPAWEAGIRPGNGIQRINGKPVTSPEEFHQIASQGPNVATLTVIQPSGRSEQIKIAAPPASPETAPTETK